MTLFDSNLPGLIGAVLTGIGGIVVGFVQWKKNQTDARLGVETSKRLGERQLYDQYEDFLELVQKHHIRPMQEQIAELRGDVAELRQEIKNERARYRAAVQHIREWQVWSDRYAPSVEPKPIPPERIKDDL